MYANWRKHPCTVSSQKLRGALGSGRDQIAKLVSTALKQLLGIYFNEAATIALWRLLGGLVAEATQEHEVMLAEKLT